MKQFRYISVEVDVSNSTCYNICGGSSENPARRVVLGAYYYYEIYGDGVEKFCKRPSVFINRKNKALLTELWEKHVIDRGVTVWLKNEK